MPYWQSALIELRNDSPTAITELRYEIQYRTTPYERGQAGYFHARSQEQQLAADGDDYVLLQETGAGHYVGTVLTMSGGTPSGLVSWRAMSASM